MLEKSLFRFGFARFFSLSGSNKSPKELNDPAGYP